MYEYWTHMTIANYLTFIRIFISPIFFLLYVDYSYFGISDKLLPYLLLALLTVSELSDALDGYFARLYNQVTDLGKILDPMADSIARISVFITFTQPPVSIPLILLFVFLYRDSVTSTLRTVCALRGFALAARPSGKIKAILQAIASFAIVLMMIPYSMGALSQQELHYYSTIIITLTAVYAVASAIEYLFANRHHIAKLLKTGEKETRV
jgi:CDP-diacylglycerol--glycerol-3-phosphate 3-phosphatidyltransferase